MNGASMVERVDIIFNGRPIARGFASPDAKRQGFRNVSIMPIDRTGDFASGTLVLHFPELISGGYPVATSLADAMDELLALAKIEPEKVQIVPASAPLRVQPPVSDDS